MVVFKIFNKNRSRKIRSTLMASFLFPVIMVIILGIVSYTLASNEILDQNYQNVTSTMAAADKYLNQIVSNITTKANALVSDTDFNNYYYNLYAKGPTDKDAIRTFNAIRSALGSYMNENDFISDFYLLSEKSKPMLSKIKSEMVQSKATVSDVDAFWTSDEFAFYSRDKINMCWKSLHPVIDSIYSDGNATYAFSYMKMFFKRDGVIIIDVSREKIESFLSESILGNDAYIGIVVSDGDEILIHQVEDENGNTVSEPMYLGSLFSTEELMGYIGEDAYLGKTTKIKYNDDDFMFYCSAIGESGMKLCALVPEKNLLSEMTKIRIITIVLVILSIIIALLIGNFISKGISSTLRNSCDALAKVSEGDLTQKFKTNRRDELYELTSSLNVTLDGIRSIMDKTDLFSNDVSISSGIVAKSSSELLTSMKNVSEALNGVTDAVQSQAKDADESASYMSHLSKRIDNMTNSTNEINVTAEKTNEITLIGREKIDQLNQSNSETTKTMDHLVNDIDEVAGHVKDIEKILISINEIADQTTLLSLNASIEAARAGEKGRGFGVVAEEIRHLSEASISAGIQIKELLEKINQSTEKVVSSAENTSRIIDEQNILLKETTKSFENISKCVDRMTGQLKSISEDLDKMVVEKDSVSDSISNMAAISEKVTFEAINVSNANDKQLKYVAELTRNASDLNAKANELKKNLNAFIK